MARKATPNLSRASADFQQVRLRAGNGSAGVRYGYRSLLGRFIQNTGDIHVGSLKPQHLEDFFYGDGGLADTCAKSTLGKYRNDLKQFLDFCHRRGWTEHTGLYLLGGVSDKSTRTNRDRFRMSREEVIRLMDAATDPRDRALIAFVANTGVRIGEALALRVKDLRLDRGEVYVKRHKTREEVTYPLTADLDVELRAWLTHYAGALDEPLAPDMFLFPVRHSLRFVGGGKTEWPEGYRPRNRIQGPRTVILPIAERAGIELEKGDGWHTIRRSVARIFFDDAAEAGHDAALRLTQALLGHKHSQTTEGYLGLDLERRQVDKLLRGKTFITKGQERDNVVRLDERRAN